MNARPQYLLRRATLASAVGILGAISGCATITGSETQNLSLQAVDASGAAVAEAECRLSNDKGSWRAKPPAIAVVNRSAEDLLVHCEAGQQPPGILRAISRANSGMIGNIIFGGGIGAMIDHSKGTAYDYPSMLKVIFGATVVVDKQNEQGDAPKNPPVAMAGPSAPIPAQPAQSAQPARPAPRAVVAGSPASPALPDVGARYRYAWNERQYSRQQEFTVTVVGVQNWTVSESLSIPGLPEATGAVDARTADFVGRRLAEGQSLLEFSPYLAQWKEGDTPALPASTSYPTGGLEPWTISARPLEWDQVSVPAGSYRALRLELRGFRRSNVTQFSRTAVAERFEVTAWYAPELKRYVKLRHRQWNGFNGDLADEQVELLAVQGSP